MEILCCNQNFLSIPYFLSNISMFKIFKPKNSFVFANFCQTKPSNTQCSHNLILIPLTSCDLFHNIHLLVAFSMQCLHMSPISLRVWGSLMGFSSSLSSFSSTCGWWRWQMSIRILALNVVWCSERRKMGIVRIRSSDRNSFRIDVLGQVRYTSFKIFLLPMARAYLIQTAVLIWSLLLGIW